jgi:aminoglycoside/choline kinase family phosphotransferase
LKSPDALITLARMALGLSSSDEVELVPLSGRGSDRTYFRFKWANSRSAILVNYDPRRVENSYFADIAAFLLKIGVPVPQIMHHDADACFMLMEDLGGTDIWVLRDSPWEIRQNLYQKSLIAVHRLHSFPISNFPSDRVRLMDPFSPTYYRWERDYFRTHFIGALCRMDMSSDFEEQLETELSGLAMRLESGKRSLVHRDLQSQNVMIRDGEPFLIDFQGMRFGSSFYDLGSLLCDPYVTFSESERMGLLSFYYGLSAEGMDWEAFQHAFWEASAQRLMQALGAYGFLGITRGLKDYLQHVAPGLHNLGMAAEFANSLPLLSALCDQCEDIIRDSKFEIRDRR